MNHASRAAQRHLIIAFGASSSSQRIGNLAQQPTNLAQVTADLFPDALEQIGSLLFEKASRTPAQLKMDSQLAYDARADRITFHTQPSSRW